MKIALIFVTWLAAAALSKWEQWAKLTDVRYKSAVRTKNSA
ncbi:MAG: hypothetical protein VCA55_15090 [Verrucomicrobiales bacterium]